MSSANDDLVLYLTLDDIQGTNQVLDSSNSKHPGTAQGATLVPDNVFGACLSFNGSNSYVEIADVGLGVGNPAHTVEAWIKVDEYPSARSWILLLGQAGSNSHHWLLNADKTSQLGAWGKSAEQFKPILPQGEWVHMAITYDGAQLISYLNGQPVSNPQLTAFNFTSNQLTLAKKGIASERDFKGEIARLRVYKRALPAAEIRQDMAADKLALPAYRRGHPIDFALYDENENYVLYISDDPQEDHQLKLELRNTSTQAIQFRNGQGAQASNQNYHFELVFRAGTLADKTLAQLRTSKSDVLKDAKGWDVAVSQDNTQKQTVSLYLLYTGKEEFKPGERREIGLRHISAAAESGTRGTQVELRPHQLSYIEDTTPITGSQVQQLHITNHLGQKYIPLHVGFVGSNRILNDGAAHPENSLTLQLMNIANLHQRHDTGSTITLNQDSKLFISFDVAEDEPWALCKDAQLPSLNASAKVVKRVQAAGGTWVEQVDPDAFNPPSDWSRGQGASQQRSLIPKKIIVLRPNDYIQIELSGFQSSLPSGDAKLYLNYEGIPGYWDGQFVCVIEKAPLLYYDVKNQPGPYAGERRVGIGTPRPHNTLDVKGAVVIGAGYAGTKTAPANGLLVEGNVGIGATSPAAKLSVMGGVHIGGTADPGSNNLHVEGNVGIGTDLQFSNVVANSHVVISRKATNAHDKGNVPSSLSLRIFDGWGDGAGVRIMNERKMPGDQGNNQYICFDTHDAWASAGERMRIAANGNVGIGTSSPGAKLSINGGLHVGGDSDPGDNNLLIDGTLAVTGDSTLNGKVGIGTLDSKAQLVILGTATISDGATIKQENWTDAKCNDAWKYDEKQDSNNHPPGYFKDSMGVVHLRGVVRRVIVKNPDIAIQRIFVLPPGYRPSADEIHIVSNNYNNIVAGITIFKDGTVRCRFMQTEDVVPGFVWISLDGVTFRAD